MIRIMVQRKGYEAWCSKTMFGPNVKYLWEYASILMRNTGFESTIWIEVA